VISLVVNPAMARQSILTSKIISDDLHRFLEDLNSGKIYTQEELVSNW
jgi:hypothetical protein